MKINEIIVVEGEHDAARLKQFFDVETIVTNGSEISIKTLNLIKEVNESRGVIVFCDPDYPGEKIRKTIIDYVGITKHAFINKDKAIDYQKNKVGIEHASKNDLVNSLENVVTFNDSISLLYSDYLKLGFSGNKSKRILLCDYLNIGYCNVKTLYKRLNMLNYTYEDLVKIMGEINE